MRKGIYIASKTQHASKWRDLRAQGWPVISTWIDEAGEGETQSFANLWQRCVDEARSAKVLVAYREPHEILKGAFIEIGCALAVNTPVLLVGAFDEMSFRHHPSVTMIPAIETALDVFRRLP